ncbi:putative cytochrome P450 family protein [Aspergillus nomiae NRRL 13137]|uniref:Putative cytochrome P450 family protein n=1 Tax=Aspergillus nomiae NRRL (strain ATCC 15546 / NRRL 13137 / CBS 260.88 / M93) TaxID=1509407 RepID=A0A0L1INL8_ASPN3|nr:putative cytochrome P450 family protein [Aspergillus nomiae NRRL 13137]KNG80915.1 putative cytochrome P450 family protein [Aspergillus nomiae NRRL 13137]
MLLRFTLDLATEFFFGTTVHSQRYSSQAPGPDNDGMFPWKGLGEDFDAATKHVQNRFRLLKFYWLHNPKSFRENIKQVHRFADFCIRDAIQRANQRNPIEMRSQSLNILFAGRDTTASLVSWSFWLLAKHPSIYNELRGHVLKHFGPYEETNRITFATLKSCEYLQYVMKEVLQLYPPTPINSRTAIRDTTLPLGGGPDGKSPIVVRKGQTVIYYIHITQSLNDFWGPDADTFDPSRWAHYKYNGAYLPFNAGPRICLGQQFALTQAGYILTRMVQKFDQAKLADPDMVPTHKLGATDAPSDYMIYFHQAPTGDN